MPSAGALVTATGPDADTSPADGSPRSTSVRRPVLLLVLGGVALFATLAVVVVPLGFDVVDGGFIQAKTWRIINGQVPHRDFLEVRLDGSALVHILDFVLPGPLVLMTRLVALVEFFVYSVLFARFIYAQPIRQWSVGHVLGALGAVLLNLAFWPLLGWPTSDGLLCIACGLTLLTASNRRLWPHAAVGMAFLGASIVMKPSFFLAPVIGLAILLSWRASKVVWRVVVGGLAASVPLVLYTGWVAVAGGLGDLVSQMRGTPQPNYVVIGTGVKEYGATIALALALVIVEARRGRTAHTADDTPRWRDPAVVVRALVTIAVLWLPFSPYFTYEGKWYFVLYFFAAALVCIRAAVNRAFEWRGATLVAVAWMVTLSWGAQKPYMMSGSLALFILHTLWVGDDSLRRRLAGAGARRPSLRPSLVAASAVTVVAIAAAVLVGRYRAPYDDLPGSRLTASVSDVSPELAGLRTSEATASYVRAAKACVNQHQARTVAFLPGFPGIYPYLKLHNPLPVDFWWPNEFAGHEDVVMRAVSSLDAGGDYLVVFENALGYRVAYGDLTRIGPVDRRQIYSPMEQQMFDLLHGTRSECGPFTLVWSPRR